MDQPKWEELSDVASALKFADKVGYPVLVRPSYVLSGAAMRVSSRPEELSKFLKTAAEISGKHPVVVSKFITNAKEIEFDGVAKDGFILNYAISEHVENAGVHSGDATLVLPAQKLYVETQRRVKRIAGNIASALKISGPFNIQFMSKNNDVKVIECNLRASRSFPFVSKTFKFNFIELATQVMTGGAAEPKDIKLLDIDYVGVKAPMFSFTRLQGADPTLGVEMASTGEVACFGQDLNEAYLLAMLSAGFKMPKKNILFAVGPTNSKSELLESVRLFHTLGFTLYGTPGTSAYYLAQGIPMIPLEKKEGDKPGLGPLAGTKRSISEASERGGATVEAKNAVEHIKSGGIDLVINIPDSMNSASETDGYRIRRATVDYSVSLITNAKCTILLATAIERMRDNNNELPCKSMEEIYMLGTQEYVGTKKINKK